MNYFDLIRTNVLHKLIPSSSYRYSPDESQIGLTIAPPLCADIRFQVGTFKLVLPKFSLSKDELALPKDWNNYTITENDPLKPQKMLVTKPVNQGKCGSCFAIAIATTISDTFLFGSKLEYNPSLSPMYILSCLAGDDNKQCDGGNPSLVIDDIIKNGGISTNCCQDYYKLCDHNMACNGKGEDHFDADHSQLGAMIPPCGHCTDKIPKMYKIKNKIISYDIGVTKMHLYQYGSGVGGFIVYNNFMGDKDRGKFLKTGGIYISSVDYAEDGIDPLTPKGGHAISIVGWGTAENVTVPIDGKDITYPRIDYWVCRNSWSENWGDKGYFKYAMYQEYKDLPSINKGHAFETDNKMLGQSIGGILLVEPDSMSDATDKDPIFKKVDCKLDYKCDRHVKVEGILNIINKNNIILYLLLAVVACVCLYYMFSSHGTLHKKRKH